MARTYKLDHFTKGTGAAVGPIEDASESPQKRELNRIRVPGEPYSRAVRRLRDPVFRLAFRVGYRVLRVWWMLAHPRNRAVKCVLTRNGQILLVRHTYGGRRRRW